MDLFDSNRDFLGVLLKADNRIRTRERNAPHLSFQRDTVIKLARHFIQIRNKKNDRETLSVTSYDERLVDHIKKNQGWDHGSQILWQRRGFDLQTAKSRVQTLQNDGFLGRDFTASPKIETELHLLKERQKARIERRIHYFREIRKQQAQEFFQKSSPGQRNFITNLGTFRQMTPAQAGSFGVSKTEVRTLQEKGIIDIHHVICEQRPLLLYSLTKSNGRNVSGKDLARDGAGIEKPVTGIQRDHSKILHDVSVNDAVRYAKQHFEKRGYTSFALISEHQMYQTKTSANSDIDHRYADAYLVMKSPGGDEETVAVEFGNYAPSYMKEKMQGIDADHRLIYTHDANRAEEYRNVMADISGPPVEVFVIPTPHMEVER